MKKIIKKNEEVFESQKHDIREKSVEKKSSKSYCDSSDDTTSDTQEKIDKSYMKMALKLARKAAERGDVPIGCVIVKDGQVLSKGYNKRVASGNVLKHAEIIAIDKACKKIGDWRLEECTMYVTLEPCPMCAGAIVQARVPRLVIGAMNPKAGCAGSVIDLTNQSGLNHRVEKTCGVCEKKSAKMMKDFFVRLRGK